jgi:hypothetical protein
MTRNERDNVETEQGGEMMAQSLQRRSWPLLLALLAALFLSGCGVNTIPTLDEQAKAAWSQVLNQYQRRADLIPNLVETVRGYATQERETLTAVVEARAKATQTQIPPDILTNQEAFQRFQQNQDATRTSCSSRRSSRAPRTASRSHGATTSRPCRPTIPNCAPFPA